MDIGIELFAHINNDAFIAGTRKLEGRTYKETIAFMQYFLEHALPSEIENTHTKELAHLRQRLDSMLLASNELDEISLLRNTEEEIYQAAGSITNRILGISIGDATQSVLMPGGWKGKPTGHAMAYEFKKDENGDLLFLIFNSGAGLEFHEPILSTDKRRYRTVKSYKIPQANLNKKDLQYFISELVKPIILEGDYNAKILYEQVFRQIAWLKGKEIEPSSLGDSYKENESIGQRSGTCAQKSLNQLIKNDITNKNTAKLILFSLKLYSIKLFLEQNENNLDAKKISQLKYATENLARILLKQRDNIPKKSQERATQAIVKVSALYQSNFNSKTLEEKQTQSLEGLDSFNQKDIKLITQKIELIAPINTTNTSEAIIEKPYNQDIVDYVEMAIDTNRFSLEKLKFFNVHLDELASKDLYKVVEQEIFSYLTKVILSKAYFATIHSFDNAIEYINEMHILLKKYGQAVKINNNSGDLTPNIIVTLLSATEMLDLAYQHSGLSFTKNGIDGLFNYSWLNFTRFKEESKFNPYLSTSSPCLDDRLEKILNRRNACDNETNIAFFKEFIQRPESQDFYWHLIDLYESEHEKGTPSFSIKEDELIRKDDYRAVVAYLHYFEQTPGQFEAQAKKIILFKKTISEIRLITSALGRFDIGELDKALSAPNKKWIYKPNFGNSLKEDFLSETYQINIKLIDFYKKIEDENVKISLTTDFKDSSYGREKKYGSNHIYSTANGIKPDEKMTEPVEQSDNDPLYQELIYLRTAPSIQFLTTIDFFQNRLDLLSDKAGSTLKNDTQQYLRRNLFQPSIMLNILKNNPDCLKVFNEFVDKAVLYFSESGKVTESALYFYALQIEVYIYVLNIENYSKEKKDDILKSAAKTLHKLELIDLSLMQPLERYQVSKIKLQLQLHIKNNIKTLFNYFMEYNENERAIKLDSHEEREEHKNVINLCLKIWDNNKEAIFDLAIKYAKEKNWQVDELNKITKQIEKFPYYYGLNDTDGQMLAMDVSKGLMLIKGGHLCYPPIQLVNSLLYSEILGDELPKLWTTMCREEHSGNLLRKYEIIDAQPPAYFLETGDRFNPYIYQQEKEVNFVKKYYEKKDILGTTNLFSLAINPNGTHGSSVKITLPETFYGQETRVWVSVDGQEIIIEKNNTQYLIHCNDINLIKELDSAMQKTEFVLHTNPKNTIASMFAHFEEVAFTEVLFKQNVLGSNIEEIKVKFPRYNIELQGKFDSISQKWDISPIDKPNLILADDHNIQTKPLMNNGLIFEDKRTNQRVIYMPNQVFYIDKKAEKKETEHKFKTVYHHPIFDRTYVDKRLKLSVGIEELEIEPERDARNNFPKGCITYTNSEKYFIYAIDSNTQEVLPNTTEEKLYLAYLNLISIQPVEAFKIVQSLIKAGGLKGTSDELNIIDKILKGVPLLAKQIDNPEYLAVRLHVLYLCADLKQQKKNFIVPDPSKFHLNTPDELWLKTYYTHLKACESTLGGQLIEHLDKKLNTKSNIPKFMRLPWELEYKILSKINIKKQHLIPLKVRYEKLKNRYRGRELGKYAVQLKNINPKKYRVKKLEIQHQKVGIVEIPVALQASYSTINPNQIHLFNQIFKNGEHNDFKVQNLKPTISEAEFVKNFICLFNLAKSTDIILDDDRRQLRDFLEKALEANCKIKAKDQKSIIPIWAPTLLTILNRANDFEAIKLAPEFIGKNSWESNSNSRFSNYVDAIFKKAYSLNKNIVIETMGYQYLANTIDLLPKEIKSNKHIPKPLEISDTNAYQGFLHSDFIVNAGLVDFYEEIESFKTKTELVVEQLKNDLALKIQGLTFEQNVNIKRIYDEKIGELRNQEESEIYKIAEKHLNNEVQLEKVILVASGLCKNIKNNIKMIKPELLRVANQGPKNPILATKFQRELMGRKREPLTQSDLNRLFVLADLNEYKRATGLDNNNDIQMLHDKMSQYINFAILKTQYKKIKNIINSFNQGDFQNRGEIYEISQLARILSDRNIILPTEEADIQFFQKEEKILIKPLQKYYLDILLHKDKETGQFSNEVIQLIMGGGKSKVIGPLSVLKKANGTNLVIFQVKNSLIETNYADMNATSQRLFNQKAILFKFDRSSPSSSKDLKQVYHLFHKASIDKNYIVTSGVSLQSLELKYLECISMRPNEPSVLFKNKNNNTDEEKEKYQKNKQEWAKQIKWFERTLLFLKNKGDRIIDEIHDELDPAKELNYTLQSPMLPPLADRKLVIDLFFFLREIPISNIIGTKNNTAFDLIFNNKLVSEPESQMPLIVEKIGGYLICNPKASQNNPILKIIKKLNFNKDQNQAFIDYILNKNDKIIPDLKAKALSTREWDELAFLKFELSKILPFTLLKSYNENYGSSRKEGISVVKSKLAIPYRALNTPNENARFGQFIESMNYTIQMNIIQEISSELVLDVIEDYLNRVRTELLNSTSGKFDNTLASIQFNTLFGNDSGITLQEISVLDKPSMNDLIGVFKKSEAFKKVVLAEYILPLVTINTTVLSSNNTNSVEITHSNQGMSGTPYNIEALSKKFIFDVLKGLGTDGETIHLLKKKKPKVIISDHYESAATLLEEVLPHHPDAKNVRALIDVGALFKKETSNLNIAKQIGEYYEKHPNIWSKPINYVLYFENKEDILYAWDILNKKRIKIAQSDEKEVAKILGCTSDERFTFYDQARITGTDIVQAPNAHALLTISEKTTLTDFLQGKKRFRNLGNNQNSTVIAPRYLVNRAGETIERVLEFVNKNQVTKCLQIHFKGANQKFKNILRRDFLNIIYHTPDPFEKNRLFNVFSPVFTKRYKPQHFINHGALEMLHQSNEYFLTLANNYYVQWLALLKRSNRNATDLDTQKIKLELDMLSKDAIHSCAQVISAKAINLTDIMTALDDDLENEVENELQLENENEEELELEKQQIFYDLKVEVFEQKKFDLDVLNHHYFKYKIKNIAHSLNIEYIKGKMVDFKFDDNLFCSYLQAKTVQGQKNHYDQYVKPIQVALMITPKTNPENFKCIILNKDEAEQYTHLSNAQLAKTYPKYDIWFVSPYGTILHGNLPAENQMPKNYLRALEQVRFVNGDAKLIAQQKEGVTWLNERTDQKMTFLKEIVLPRHHQKAKDFKILKIKLDIYSKIIQHMLDNPFVNYLEFNWKLTYPNYIQLPKGSKNNVKAFAFALAKVNKWHSENCNDPRLQSGVFDDFLEKFDLKLRLYINHHKINILDKRTKIINVFNSSRAGENDFNFLFTHHYQDIDLNFTVYNQLFDIHQTLAEIAISNGHTHILEKLINMNKINLELKASDGQSNEFHWIQYQKSLINIPYYKNLASKAYQNYCPSLPSFSIFDKATAPEIIINSNKRKGEVDDVEQNRLISKKSKKTQINNQDLNIDKNKRKREDDDPDDNTTELKKRKNI